MAETKLKMAVAVGLGILLAARIPAFTVEGILPGDPPKQKQILADGSILTLEALNIGWTNVLRVISATKKAGFTNKLATALSAEFRLSGAKPENGLVKPAFFRQFRTAVVGDDTIEYITEVHQFKKYGDDYYGYLDTRLFSRESLRLRIQIQQRDIKDGPWRTIAEFTHFQAPAKQELWQPEQTPVTRSVEGMQVNLGEVTVQIMSLEQDPLWNRNVVIPWQLKRNGVLLDNWDLHDVIIRDSSGNGDYIGTQRTGASEGWIINRAWRSPDIQKIWKIEAQLAQDGGFAETNIFTVRIPLPLERSFETNLGGYPFRIGMVNNNMVSTELLLTNRTDLRLNFMHVEDQTGKDINDGSGSWGQFNFFRSVLLPRDVGEVVVTFAIGRNIPVEFVIKPRLMSAPPTKNERD